MLYGRVEVLEGSVGELLERTRELEAELRGGGELEKRIMRYVAEVEDKVNQIINKSQSKKNSRIRIENAQ